MTLDPDVQACIRATFGALNRQRAAHVRPQPLALPHAFDALLARHHTVPESVTVNLQIAKLFSTAAVESWQRGVHSYLISTALTEASPLWASVSGYYSSHYCIRGLAHLLGHLSLYRRKRTVSLVLQGTNYVCSLKQPRAREHLFYWQVVKRNQCFAQNPLFTENPEDTDVSDAAHRNYANYADHLFSFPTFRTLDELSLRHRVQFISRMRFTEPPIPDRDRWPDLDSVQVVAYHRIVAFRRFLDDVLGGANGFWNIHRNPGFATDVLDFQLVEQGLRAEMAQGLVR
jgi:hypothetical protein